MAQRTGIQALDQLIEAFEQSNPEIPNDWRGTSRPLAEMRFAPAHGQDQPSRGQCGSAAGVFSDFLSKHGDSHKRSWGAIGVAPGPDGRPDPAARPIDHELPPERDNYHFIFYADVDPETVTRDGLPADVVLATTPEATGVAKPARVVIDDMTLGYHHFLRRVGENQFTTGRYMQTDSYVAAADPDFTGLPADGIRSATLHQGSPTATRMELLSESDPRHPTNLVAAQMDPNPFELVYQGKLDIETGLDWSLLYGYEDGKYRRRKDKTHEATVVSVDGEIVMIDWTAGQYGYQEFPMVQRWDPKAASWQREFTVRPKLSSVDETRQLKKTAREAPVFEQVL